MEQNSSAFRWSSGVGFPNRVRAINDRNEDTSPGQSASVSNIGATSSALHMSQTSTTAMEMMMLTKAAFAVGFFQNMP